MFQKNQIQIIILTLSHFIPSMLNTGNGIDSKTPDEVTNRFALAIVAAKVLSGDSDNVNKWSAVDECFSHVREKSSFPIQLVCLFSSRYIMIAGRRGAQNFGPAHKLHAGLYWSC